jgi:hypothetical protein
VLNGAQLLGRIETALSSGKLAAVSKVSEFAKELEPTQTDSQAPHDYEKDKTGYETGDWAENIK